MNTEDEFYRLQRELKHLDRFHRRKVICGKVIDVFTAVVVMSVAIYLLLWLV